MKDHKIQAFLIQETHLAEEYTSELPEDFLLIHHGPEKQPASGAKGGIAIILSKEWSDLWKKGGCIIRREATLVGGTTRILGIDIPIPNNKKNKDGKIRKVK